MGKGIKRKINIIRDSEGKKIVLINDIRFRGKRKIAWKEVEQYLKEYVGNYYEIAETSERIYIGSEFPDEFTGSKDTKLLKGTLAKAKANATQGIPELIETATNEEFSLNQKEKHKSNAKFGWYRYDTRFALPVYGEDGEIERYNIFNVRMLIRHDQNGKKYLYDMLKIKKETSKPLKL